MEPCQPLTRGSPDPQTRSYSKIQKKKRKKKRKLAATSEEKKKKIPFIFLCMPFILFAILKKKNEISNFKIQKFKNSKKKKNRILKFKIQKKERKWDILFWFYLHEPRSSQAIEPLNWDLEPRLFEDLSLWVTEPRSEPLSHDPTKPSRDLFQAKIQATEPLSWDLSHRAKIRAKPSCAKIIELFFCKQTQRFH